MNVYLYAGRWADPGNLQNLMTREKVREDMDVARLDVGEYTPGDQDELEVVGCPPQVGLLLQA